MRINGFRCDICCKEHLLDPTLIFQHANDAMPDDWFIVSKGKWQNGKEAWLFCSLKCLSDWVEKQLIAASPVEVLQVDHEPYRYCCMYHYPLPERNKPW